MLAEPGFAIEVLDNPRAGFGPVLVGMRVEDASLPTVLIYGRGMPIACKPDPTSARLLIFDQPAASKVADRSIAATRSDSAAAVLLGCVPNDQSSSRNGSPPNTFQRRFMTIQATLNASVRSMLAISLIDEHRCLAACWNGQWGAE